MRQVLIDTNIYSHFKRNDSVVVDAIRGFESIVVNTTVLGELRCGYKLGKNEKKNLYELDLFLDSPRVRVVALDEVTAEFYAQVYAQLRQRGLPIPTNDMWIAASAMQHGLALYTLDKHFTNISGLVLH